MQWEMGPRAIRRHRTARHVGPRLNLDAQEKPPGCSPAKKELLALEVCREEGELGLGSPCLQRLRKGVGNFSVRDDTSFVSYVMFVCFATSFSLREQQ